MADCGGWTVKGPVAWGDSSVAVVARRDDQERPGRIWTLQEVQDLQASGRWNEVYTAAMNALCEQMAAESESE